MCDAICILFQCRTGGIARCWHAASAHEERVFLHRTTVAIAYSAMSFAVRDSAMCLSRAQIQQQKSFCDSSYATTFASARFQHIPTQSCCMLSFKIGSLRRAS